MESLLEGEAEQLTRKALELALAGDITALRLCLERLVPPRKDRSIHLILPPIENVQQISLAMAKVTAAIGEGEITPLEGEVLSNILAAHKAVLVTGDLERRVDELEQRTSKRDTAVSATPHPSEVRATMAPMGVHNQLANRLNRLERRLGPPPPPMSNQVSVRAWTNVFSMEELTSFEPRWEALETSGYTSLLDIFGEGTAERREILRRLEPALDTAALEMTGKPYAELLREEAVEQE